MKEVRFRQYGSYFYLIPWRDIDQFDRFCELLSENKESDNYDDMVSDFDNEYAEFAYEGSIYDLPIYIKDNY